MVWKYQSNLSLIKLRLSSEELFCCYLWTATRIWIAQIDFRHDVYVVHLFIIKLSEFQWHFPFGNARCGCYTEGITQKKETEYEPEVHDLSLSCSLLVFSKGCPDYRTGSERIKVRKQYFSTPDGY